MNPLYILDHFIFSVFMTLILIEGGFAVTALLAYGKYKERLMRYITPIWEVTGTFAVFYAVNFEATFPKLLGAAGTIYAVPLLVAAALIIIRNAFLIHAEYLGDIKREAKYLKVYAIATIAALVILMSVLSSAMTGAGISLASSSASLSMYINPFNLIVVACSILMALSLAAGIFHIERIGKFAWLPLALAVMLFYAGIYPSCAGSGCGSSVCGAGVWSAGRAHRGARRGPIQKLEIFGNALCGSGAVCIELPRRCSVSLHPGLRKHHRLP